MEDEMDNITRYTLTFVLYAFIGYLCEVVYCSIGQRHLVDRGFLYGPWLPIYGFGGLIVDIFLCPIASHPVLVFLLAVVLTSAVEYVGSWALEKIFSIASEVAPDMMGLFPLQVQHQRKSMPT